MDYSDGEGITIPVADVTQNEGTILLDFTFAATVIAFFANGSAYISMETGDRFEMN